MFRCQGRLIRDPLAVIRCPNTDYRPPITEMITLPQLEQLPCFHRATIGAEHLDVMGHMNVPPLYRYF